MTIDVTVGNIFYLQILLISKNTLGTYVSRAFYAIARKPQILLALIHGLSRSNVVERVCSFPGKSRENSINNYAHTTSEFCPFSSGSIARVLLEDIKTQSSSITVGKKLNVAKQENNHSLGNR